MPKHHISNAHEGETYANGTQSLFPRIYAIMTLNLCVRMK